MEVRIINRRNREFEAQVKELRESDLDHLGADWKFNWKELYTTKTKFYKVIFEREVQGIIKLEEENSSYYVLKNIEVAPWNFGSKGKFKNIAEILMSFACLKSFELNTGSYKGFLVFTSKGVLMEYYERKYNAEPIFRERMIINPEAGKRLILLNLEIDLSDE